MIGTMQWIMSASPLKADMLSARLKGRFSANTPMVPLLDHRASHAAAAAIARTPARRCAASALALLGARRERPRCRRTAEKRDAIAATDVDCHATLRLGVIHAMEG